jgi:hypothetical protein
MSTADLFVGVPLLAAPIALGAAWWKWSRRDRSASPRWRLTALFLGLIAATLNGALFYGWAAYGFIFTRTPSFWAAKNALADHAGIYLAVASLAGAIAGKSRGRILLALAAFLQVLLWANLGFL